MGFFNALRRALGAETMAEGDPIRPIGEANDGVVAQPAGIATSHRTADGPAVPVASTAPSAYDREHWHKKLKHILERLPQSQASWKDLMIEAGGLGLDRAWVQACFREEFQLLVRAVVGDRIVTPVEHRKLDLARSLMGIPEDEAIAVLNAIVAEAEEFFGDPIEGA